VEQQILAAAVEELILQEQALLQVEVVLLSYVGLQEFKNTEYKE
jgi:hypothetical protein